MYFLFTVSRVSSGFPAVQSNSRIDRSTGSTGSDSDNTAATAVHNEEKHNSSIKEQLLLLLHIDLYEYSLTFQSSDLIKQNGFKCYRTKKEIIQHIQGIFRNKVNTIKSCGMQTIMNSNSVYKKRQKMHIQ